MAGFAADRAFVLPLRADLVATPFAAQCRLTGLRLRRKPEFHATVLSRRMAHATADCGEAQLGALYESL